MSEIDFENFDIFDTNSSSMEVAILLEDNYPHDLVHTTANFLQADVNVSLVDDDMFNIFYEANDELFDSLNLENSVALAIPVASLLVPRAQSILTTEAVLTNPSDDSNYMDLYLCSKISEYEEVQLEDFKISYEDAAAISAQLSEEKSAHEQHKCGIEDVAVICAQALEETSKVVDCKYDIVDVVQRFSSNDPPQMCYSSLFCGLSNAVPIQRARSFIALSEEQCKENRARAREKWLKKRENRIQHNGEKWNKARKSATAKRARENGKFKRCTSTWVTLSDFQKSSSTESLTTAAVL